MYLPSSYEGAAVDARDAPYYLHGLHRQDRGVDEHLQDASSSSLLDLDEESSSSCSTAPSRYLCLAQL